MQKIRWTDAQKQEALRIFREAGVSEASRLTGIPVGTIASWANRGGIKTADTDRPAHIASKQLTIAERKGQLVLGMLDDIERLRPQLFAEYVEKKPMVVSLGRDAGSVVEIAEVELSQPSPADQNRIVDAMTKLLDKVLLLSGDATARVEQTGQQADDRAKAEATVLKLAQRAA